MSYYFAKLIDSSFDEAVDKTKLALNSNGFGIISEIDIKENFKKKLDIDFKKYKILGACNPSFAYKALLYEDKIGTMLPCNVIVQELDINIIEVAAIDPVASMASIKNVNLDKIAKEVQRLLKESIAAI
jgi:uncharacterized protein (DUF302 family)